MAPIERPVQPNASGSRALGRLFAVAKALVATAIAIVLAHQASLLLHEWAHGTIAWIFGYKPSPFAIHYGDWTLLDADEAIDYRAILAAGRGPLVAAIAIAPIILGGALYVAGTPLLALRAVQRRKALWVFLYWFNLSNLGQVLDYIPQRTFVAAEEGLLRGDIGHFVQGLGVSPWIVCVPGVLFVAAGVVWLLRNEVPRAYAVLAVERSGRAALLALTLAYLFCWYGMAGRGYGFPSNALSLASPALAIVLFIVCRPKRRWVGDRAAAFAAAGEPSGQTRRSMKTPTGRPRGL